MQRQIRAVLSFAVLLPVLALGGCFARASADLTAAQKLVSPYGLSVASSLGTQEVTLPDRLDPLGSDGFSAPFVYSLIQEAASQGGYDLRPHLGARVVERQYRLRGSDTLNRPGFPGDPTV